MPLIFGRFARIGARGDGQFSRSETTGRRRSRRAPLALCRQCAYLPGMGFWRNVSPRGAVGDFLDTWRQPQPYRWQILGIAVALTFAIMMLFIPKSERADPERPTITYISTLDETRTDAEIVASNQANQKRKEEAEAILAARVERRKELYRALGRATGVDVAEMERKIKAEEAAEAAAKAEQQRQINANRAATAAAEASTAGE
ncbi:hypothetical protein [Tsuneonella sp. HG222]